MKIKKGIDLKANEELLESRGKEFPSHHSKYEECAQQDASCANDPNTAMIDDGTYQQRINIRAQANELNIELNSIIMLQRNSDLGIALRKLQRELLNMPRTDTNLETAVEIMTTIINTIRQTNIETSLLSMETDDDPAVTRLLDKCEKSSRSLNLSNKQPNAIDNLVKKLGGKGPMWGKVLGIVLIISGILLGTACAASMIATGMGSSIPAGFGITYSSSLLATGFSFFGIAVGGTTLYASRDTGISKTVQNVACAMS